MKRFDYDPTIRVLYGHGVIDKLGESVQEIGGRRLLLVTDRGVWQAGHPGRAIESLKRFSLESAVFDQVVENPNTTLVEAGAAFARENGPFDCIVGLGGGSCLDCAKGINFLLTNGGRMEDYWGMGKAALPMLPSVGIPTTAGTGSEAQSYALISQAETHAKMACGDRKARFRVVLLDPSLLASQPRRVAAATAMDAVSHAIESYVTVKRNPVSQLFAREAWRLLEGSFERALQDPTDTDSAGRMLLGAHWAGVAIENSMLGAAHACANPLTARHDVTHGSAVGIMLPHVVRYNAAEVGDCYRELLAVSSASNGQADVEGLVERLQRFQQRGGLPSRLRDCAVGREDLAALADQALPQWTGGFNPRPMRLEGYLRLYESAF